MKNSYQYCIILLLVVFGSCLLKEKQKAPSIYIQETLKFHIQSKRFLDSLHYTKYYTESKWKMYLKYCDKKVCYDDYQKKSNTPVFFGELDMYLFSANIRDDTLLNFLFMIIINDTSSLGTSKPFCDTTMRHRLNHWHYWDIKNNKFYGYGFDQGVIIDSTELNDYCDGVPNCDSAKKHFIEAHKGELNPWFVSEAVKRGFISP